MAVQIDQQTQFRDAVDAVLEAYFERYPGYAAHLGFHDYDGRVTDFDPAAISAWLGRVRDFRETLATFDREALSAEERLDLDVLDLALDGEIHEWEERAEWRRNPMAYLWALDASDYLKRDYAPLALRVAAVVRLLGEVPRVLAQARANLTPPLPVTFVEMSGDMFGGTLEYLQSTLPGQVEPVGAEHPELFAQFRAAQPRAADAVREFVAWLEALKAGATDDFAIGRRGFERMLWTGEAVDVPLERLLAIGQADLERNKANFEATAKALDPGRTPAELMAALGAKHPTAAKLVDETRAMLEELRDWVIAHDIVGVPSEVRIRVEETPPFMRWAFAMMDSPGPFESKADEAFYYVTPPERDWPPEQQEEWLTKFDYATLRDVSMHEAYPGHYVHYLHSRAVASRVRRIFGAYSFWEAWAHYVEQLMVEAGFRPDDLELRLAQLSEALLRDVRFITSIRMHTEGMTVGEATAMFREHAHMPEKPARQEAVRGTFDPGFLNYTLGKLMLLKLRDDAKAEAKAEGRPFSLRAFHDQFLSYGAPPVPLVRREMLGEVGEIL